MNREAFLKRCASFTAGVACFDILVVGCSSLPYIEFSFDGASAIVKKSAFGEKEFVLLNVDSLPAPVYISKQGDNDYVALLLRCTHRGCKVQPAGDILECPCHGSRYTRTGIVVRGPAPNSLKQLPVEIGPEYLRVSLT